MTNDEELVITEKGHNLHKRAKENKLTKIKR
jgi:hypothetical protein